MTHPWFNEQVERRVREWLLEQERLRREEQERVRPLIIVAGDHGALREHVARNLSARLGYRYWDREILHEMSRGGPMPESLLESLDERRTNAWTEAFAGFRPRPTPRAADYRRVLESFVRELVGAGRAVVVGRGVRFLVSASEGFRVHVTAPREHRIRTIMRVKALDRDEAVRRIDLVDAERAGFVRDLFDRDIHELEGLDLVVNTGTLGVEPTVDTIIDAYRRRFDFTTQS